MIHILADIHSMGFVIAFIHLALKLKGNITWEQIFLVAGIAFLWEFIIIARILVVLLDNKR